MSEYEEFIDRKSMVTRFSGIEHFNPPKPSFRTSATLQDGP
jgi:hypothetical protein